MNFDFILCADMHFHWKTPACRTDDFLAAQETKHRYIAELCRNNDATLLIAGDIGEFSEWPCWALTSFIRNFGDLDIVACWGNHDLPGHASEMYLKSGVGVLFEAGIIKQNKHGIDVFNFDQEIVPSADAKILITHQMVTETPDKHLGGSLGVDLLDKFPQYDLILTGDNHKQFVVEKDGRLLINPGSVMRTTAAQIDHKPAVFGYDSERVTFKPLYLPIENDVISREHIDSKKDKEARMELVRQISKRAGEASDLMGGSTDFKTNCETRIKSEDVTPGIKDKVLLSLEGKTEWN